MKKKNIILAILLAFASIQLQAQRIVTDESSIDLGQILFRDPITAVYNLKNGGDKPLVIHDVKKSCGCTSVSFPHRAILAGEKFKVEVTYDAKLMGHFDKLIGLYSNASENPTILRLKGVVVSDYVGFSGAYHFQIGDLKLDVNDIEFDDVNRGDRPVAQIHVFNAGRSEILPQVMHLPPYLTANVSPSRLAAGQAGIISLTLDSKKLRNFGLSQTSLYLGMFPGDKVAPEKEISVSSVLLPAFDETETNSIQALAPKLKITSNTLDLGSFGKKTKLKGVLELENVGKSDLDIRSMQMFTEGFEMSLNKTKLAPGEKAKLKVTALKRQLKKVRSKPRVLMITNDPSYSKVIIHINVKD